jgi:hypothetical protein
MTFEPSFAVHWGTLIPLIAEAAAHEISAALYVEVFVFIKPAIATLAFEQILVWRFPDLLRWIDLAAQSSRSGHQW